jgi:putative membrane protein
MKNFIIKWIINTIAVAIVVKILPGITVDSFGSLIMASLLLGVIAPILRALLIFFTLPLFILTFGLIYFIINGFILYLIAGIIPGFDIASFWWALLASLIISLSVSLINWIIKDDKDKDNVIVIRR